MGRGRGTVRARISVERVTAGLDALDENGGVRAVEFDPPRAPVRETGGWWCGRTPRRVWRCSLGFDFAAARPEGFWADLQALLVTDFADSSIGPKSGSWRALFGKLLADQRIGERR